jgi:hypothetical protein
LNQTETKTETHTETEISAETDTKTKSFRSLLHIIKKCKKPKYGYIF